MLSGPDLETVYRDVTLANDNIRLGRGIGAETMFGGGEDKIFAINQDVPGDGYLAERSRRILAKAMEKYLKNLSAIPDAKSVSICQWDLAATTAALYVKPANIQAVFKNLAELPDGILRYDTGNQIFQIRFGLPGEHDLQISLCFPKPWKEVRNGFPQPLRTLMDEANRIAVQDFIQKQAWRKANPGKTVPRSFLAPSSAGVVYLDKR